MPDDIMAIIDGFETQRPVAARATTVGNIAENPDTAARAMELSKASGVPPTVILDDVEGFEAQQKGDLASRLVGDNAYLSDFVLDNPMAPKLANDDYGTLDEVSSVVGRLGDEGALSRVASAFREGFDLEGLNREYQRLYNVTPELLKGFLLNPVTGSAIAAVPLSMAAFNSAIYGLSQGVGETARALGESDAWAQRLVRDVRGAIEANTAGPMLARGPIAPAVKKQINDAAQAWKVSESYVRAGQEPPVGLDQNIDKVKADQAKVEVDTLSEAVSVAQKSKLKERSEDMFADFIRTHQDGTIGISADAVRELYGDKVPDAADGLLGWAPRIAEQLEVALATGADVQVPVADWIARVDPAVEKQLKDFIRIRPEGINLDEVAKLAEYKASQIEGIETYHGSPAEFTEFSNEKIGTGEGAQVISYGHYLAEEKAVGTEYRDKLAPSMVDGELFDKNNPRHELADMLQYNYDPVKFLDTLRLDIETMQETNWPGDVQQIAKYKKWIEYIEAGDVPKLESAPSNLYKTKIKRKPEEFLDWDTDLSSQPAGQKILKDINPEFKALLDEYLDEHGQPAVDELTGKQFHQLLERYATEGELPGVEGNEANPHFKREASEFIHKMGIPGVKFLDNFSRTAGEGTRNYVVYDPKDIQITHRNDQVIESVRQAAALEPVLGKVEGKVGGEAASKLDATATPEAIAEREAFDKAAAIGMTVDQYKRYMRLIEKRTAEDIARAERRAAKEAEVRTSQLWKEREAEIRPEVVEQIQNRPPVAADEYLRNGVLFGEAQPESAKIGTEYLTKEQREALPPNYVSKKGMDPNDLASLFGYDSGAQMMQGLVDYNAERRASGMRPDDFRRRSITAEVERRLSEELGPQRAEILEEAKDAVLGETQVDLLHEETLQLGLKAGTEFSITKDQLRTWVAEKFDGLMLNEAKSDSFLSAAGRAGRDAEMGLLKSDFAEAFRQKQRQYIAVEMAKQARALEKSQKRLEKRMKPYSKREIPKQVSGEYANFVQSLMSQAGVKMKLLPDEIVRGLEAEGHANLDSFIAERSSFGEDFNVPEAYTPKQISAMTVGEWRDFNDAITSLDHNGREAKKINVAGEKIDYAEWRDEAINQLKQRPMRDIDKMGIAGRWLYKIDSTLTKPEELFAALDFREEMGPFFGAIVQPFEFSKAKAFTMIEDLSKRFKGLKEMNPLWEKTLTDTIPQDFIFDPRRGMDMKLTRWNLVKMMQNMGNKSNFEALAKGIASAAEGKLADRAQIDLTKARLKALVDQHATKDDWDFVQATMDLFEPFQKEVDVLNRNTTGKVAKWIEAEAMVTPHGTYRGGYFPLFPDKTRIIGEGIKEKAQPTGTGPLPVDYLRANTPKSYLKERTGGAYWVDITNGPAQMAGRMQQMIHDVAYRDFVIGAGKVLWDPKVMQAISDHYGVEYANQLKPWLKAVANEFTAPEAELSGWNETLGQIRINLIAHAIPLNYAVLGSPSVGTLNPKAFYNFMSNYKANMAQAMEKSKELPHLLYNMDRDINAAITQVVDSGGYTHYQRQAVQWLLKPMVWMEQQTRAVTWHDIFGEGKGMGLTDVQAASRADAVVRQRHGATSLGDLAPLLRNKSEFTRMATLFFGYFSNQYNWMRTVPDAVRQGDMQKVAKTLWGTVGVAAMFNAALFTKRKEEEGIFSFLGRAVAQIPMSMIPGLRDVWSLYSEGYKSTSPLVAAASNAGALLKDGYKFFTEPGTPKNMLKHTANVAGQVAGIPGMLQVGRTGQFAYDYATGAQRPKDLNEFMRGVFTGDSKLKK